VEVNRVSRLIPTTRFQTIAAPQRRTFGAHEYLLAIPALQRLEAVEVWATWLFSDAAGASVSGEHCFIAKAPFCWSC